MNLTRSIYCGRSVNAYITYLPSPQVFINQLNIMAVKSIAEILSGSKISNWSGSEKTRDMVAQQIKEIWGEAELQNYDPEKSALPFSKWLSLGYVPKKGSKALKSVTVIEKKDSSGNVISRYARNINLFYYRSVQPLADKKPC